MTFARNLAMCALVALFVVSNAQASLIISEYVEGSSFNKAIELFNPTDSAIDLDADNVQLDFFFNGSGSAGVTVDLSGVIAAKGTFVVADDGGNFGAFTPDQTSTSNFFSGDDAIELTVNGVVTDSIGQVGFDPGTQWGAGDLSTQNNTIRRNANISMGDTDSSDDFEPSLAAEWTGFSIDTFDGLGAHDFIEPADTVKILNQDFNDLSGAGLSTFNTDQFGVGTSDNPLTNTAASYDGATPIVGAGTPFVTLWTDTEGDVGPRDDDGEGGDFIGVNFFSGASAPNVDAAGDAVVAGNGNFEFNDADGRLDLVFDNIDASSVEGVQLMFDLWVNDTGFESTDSLVVTVSDGVNSATVLDFGEAELEGANVIGDTGDFAEWNNILFDVSGAGVTGDTLSVIFSVQTNSGAENIFVDNIMLVGTRADNGGAVPEPTTLGLLGLAGLALSRRRRLAAA